MLSLTMVVTLSVASQVPTFPPVKTDPITKRDYYDLDVPPEPPASLKLWTGADGKTLVILTKNVLGVWEGTNAGTTYRMKKELLPYTWRDKTTRAWWYTVSALPSAAPIPTGTWIPPDNGFRFQPFHYGRSGIGVIQP